MFQEALFTKTAEVLERLLGIDLLKDFYLAGGTALALKIGHRKSIDLDFFSSNYPNKRRILKSIEKFNPQVIQEALGTLDLIINDVKVSFLEYNYPLISDNIEYRGISIAGVLDIAAMKISAISSRGSKKDFVDIYFILQDYSLSEILDVFDRKYIGVDYSKSHLLKSLAYFEDAESDPDPNFIKDVDWQTVKKSLSEKCQSYLKKY